MLFHLCLWTSGSEASRKLTDSGPQWAARTEELLLLLYFINPIRKNLIHLIFQVSESLKQFLQHWFNNHHLILKVLIKSLKLHFTSTNGNLSLVN